jgi:hypothetical protein
MMKKKILNKDSKMIKELFKKKKKILKLEKLNLLKKLFKSPKEFSLFQELLKIENK